MEQCVEHARFRHTQLQDERVELCGTRHVPAVFVSAVGVPAGPVSGVGVPVGIRRTNRCAQPPHQPPHREADHVVRRKPRVSGQRAKAAAERVASPPDGGALAANNGARVVGRELDRANRAAGIACVVVRLLAQLLACVLICLPAGRLACWLTGVFANSWTRATSMNGRLGEHTYAPQSEQAEAAIAQTDTHVRQTEKDLRFAAWLTDRQTIGWMDGRTDGQTGRWTDRLMD
eukprot:290481-Chlamydomonas_euryale.AAC.2